jgi:hypothetical protein
MAKTNGKSEMKSRDLDIEHELPAAEAEQVRRVRNQQQIGLVAVRLQDARKVRDADRFLDPVLTIARIGAAREQQISITPIEAIKSLLPVIDNLSGR